MNFEDEIKYRMEKDPRWRTLPYDYAVISIALMLTFQQAYAGFTSRKPPEEVMFEVEGFTPEQIEAWNNL